jgi:hypothetical protein
MPYIKPARRKVFDVHLEAYAQEIEGEGELNYCIYKLFPPFSSTESGKATTSSVCARAPWNTPNLNCIGGNCPLTRTRRLEKMGIFE